MRCFEIFEKKIFLLTITLFFLLLPLQNTAAQSNCWNNIIAPRNTITSLVEQGNYIWAATDIGLLKMNKNDGSFTLYDKTYGLPSNNVSVIAINKNGDVWFGLSNVFSGEGYGLVKFDGKNFTLYNSSNSKLPMNCVSALCFDMQGNLWIACSFELAHTYLVKYDGKDWTIYDSQNSPLPQDRVIKSLAIDKSKLWIGSNSGLFSFDGNSWLEYSTPVKIINSVFVNSKNNKWIGMFYGIAKYDNSTWTILSEKDSASPLYYNSVQTVFIDKDGILWAGTYKGLVKYDFNTWSLYSTSNSGLPGNQVQAIISDNEDNKWIGSFESSKFCLSKFNGLNWQNYKTWKGDLRTNIINYIDIKKSNILCIGAISGLQTIDGNNWEWFTWQDSLLSQNKFYSFVSSTSDNLGNEWYALRGDWPIGHDPISGILKYEGGNWTKYDPKNSNLPVCQINNIKYSVSDCLLWAATSIGVIKYNGTNWKVIDTVQKIFPKPYISTMLVDKNIKWFGSIYYGLLRYDNFSWKLYNTGNSGLPDNNVRSLYLDDKGILWICTANGLAKFDGEKWEVYNTGNSGLPGNYINCFMKEKNNTWWIGTLGGGAAEFDGINWNIYNTDNSPLLSNSISCIAEDGQGNIWIASDGKGISIYNRSGLFAVKPESKESVPIKLELLQNFPNPFNPTTTIRYNVSVAGFVSIKVFDVLGRETATLVNEEKTPGTYKINFNANNLSSGVYFYRMQAGSFIQTRKMLLLR